MSEDTKEWVNDWFDGKYYKISPKDNPRSPATGTEKVLRGSVGGRAEISAMVFMRSKDMLQTMRPTFPNGIMAEEVMVPFPGFSGYNTYNFRCTVNSNKKIIKLHYSLDGAVEIVRDEILVRRYEEKAGPTMV